jgi:hypothetical protein
LALPGFEPWTVPPAASRYTDYGNNKNKIKIKPGKEKQRKKADKDKRK